MAELETGPEAPRRVTKTRLELAGVAEAAEILGITKQGVGDRRLRQNAAGPRFPEPVAELRCGPIWRRRDLIAYARELRQYDALDFFGKQRYDSRRRANAKH